jgi:hypothetical protein
VDCCVLANNHVLDWGYRGLEDTLATLRGLGIAKAGAGRDVAEAAAPALLALPGGGRVLVLAFAHRSSGVPWNWAAAEHRAGVNLLSDLGEATVDRIAREVRALRRPGDIVLASIHWGGNWGYQIPESPSCSRWWRRTMESTARMTSCACSGGLQRVTFQLSRSSAVTSGSTPCHSRCRQWASGCPRWVPSSGAARSSHAGSGAKRQTSGERSHR